MTGPMTGKVWIDGVEQERVTMINFSVGVPHMRAKITLQKDIYPTTTEIVGFDVQSVVEEDDIKARNPGIPYE